MSNVTTFCIPGYEWNVIRARELFADRLPTTVPVSEFAPLLPRADRLGRLGDCAHYDLDTPIWVAGVPEGMVNGHDRIIIDGWHRLKSAVTRRALTLPAVILSADECNIYGILRVTGAAL